MPSRFHDPVRASLVRPCPARACTALLLLLGTGCASSSKGGRESQDSDPKPISGIVEATNKPSPIGKFLAEIDAQIRAWNNLLLTAQSEEDRRKLEIINARNEADQVIFVIEKQLREHADKVPADQMAGEPDFERIRQEPGFEALLKQQNP